MEASRSSNPPPSDCQPLRPEAPRSLCTCQYSPHDIPLGGFCVSLTCRLWAAPRPFIHSFRDSQGAWQFWETEMQGWDTGTVGATMNPGERPLFWSHTWTSDLLSGESRPQNVPAKNWSPWPTSSRQQPGIPRRRLCSSCSRHRPLLNQIYPRRENTAALGRW